MDPSLTTLGVSVGVVSNLVEIGLHNPCFKNTLWFLLLERRGEKNSEDWWMKRFRFWRRKTKVQTVQ